MTVQNMRCVHLVGSLLSLGLAGCHPLSASGETPTNATSHTRDLDLPPTNPEPHGSSAEPSFAWRHEYAADADAGLFALVEAGSVLHIRANARDAGATYDGLHPLLVKVTDRSSEHVAIALDWPDRPSAHHCAGARSDDLGLQLFVDVADLADLTTTASSVAFASGGGVNVASGVPVTQGHGGRVKLTSNGLSSPRYVGPDYFVAEFESLPLEFGKFYVPTLRPSLPKWRPTDAKGQLRYEGGTLRFATPMDLVFEQAEPDLILVGSTCLQVAGVHEPIEDEWSRPNGGWGCLLPPTASDAAWDVQVGATLSWPDGSDAGRVIHPVVIWGSLHKRGSKLCFDHILGCSLDSAVRVCVAPSDISEAQPVELTSTGPSSAR